MVLQPEEDAVLDFDAVERWTVMHCPIFDRIFLFVLAASFGLETGNEEFALLPAQGVKLQVNLSTQGISRFSFKNNISYPILLLIGINWESVS